MDRTDEDRAMKCVLCDFVAKTPQGLSSHDRNRHWFENACPLCEGGGGPACSWHFA